MAKFKVKSLADSDFHLPDILGREFREKTEDIYGKSMNNFKFGDQTQRCDANQLNLFTDVLLLRNNEPVKEKVVKLHLQNVKQIVYLSIVETVLKRIS